MTLRKISKTQPESFEFTNENMTRIKNIMSKYPDGKKTKCSNAITLHSTGTK